MTLGVASDQLTDKQIEAFTALIYEVAGIRISSKKKTMLSNRLRRRLKACNLDCFDAYYRLLKRLPGSDPEWDGFLQEVSTHETYLFRDEIHWDWFRKQFLPGVEQQARQGKRPKSLRVWSAACSTGDEAYTIASCIASTLTDRASWKVKIIGTDIGVGAVEAARRAEFNQRSMHLVPPEISKRFFTPQLGGSLWKAKPALAEWTEFHQHNLLEPLRTPAFDVVFLKNVLIYFDKPAKLRALGHIEQLLKPGGFLITAAADGVAPLLKKCKKVQPWLFRKQ